MPSPTCQFPVPSVDNVRECIDTIWLICASAPRPQDPNGVNSFYEVLTSNTLEPIYKGLGFSLLDDFLSHELCQDVLTIVYEKHEWDNFVKKKYIAKGFEDCNVITNMMTEGQIVERNREQTRQKNRTAKYSTEEFQLKSIDFRETIVRLVHLLQKNNPDTHEVSWTAIQTAWQTKFNEKLGRNILRDIFPTGCPQNVVQRHMRAELGCRSHDSSTFFVWLKKPLEELIKNLNDVKTIKTQNTADIVKAPKMRTDQCHYIDFERNRVNKASKTEDETKPHQQSTDKTDSLKTNDVSKQHDKPSTKFILPELTNFNNSNLLYTSKSTDNRPSHQKIRKIAEKAKESWTFGSLRKDISRSFESVLEESVSTLPIKVVNNLTGFARVSSKNLTSQWANRAISKSFLDN